MSFGDFTPNLRPLFCLWIPFRLQITSLNANIRLWNWHSAPTYTCEQVLLVCPDVTVGKEQQVQLVTQVQQVLPVYKFKISDADADKLQDVQVYCSTPTVSKLEKLWSVYDRCTLSCRCNCLQLLENAWRRDVDVEGIYRRRPKPLCRPHLITLQYYSLLSFFVRKLTTTAGSLQLWPEIMDNILIIKACTVVQAVV